MPHFDIIIGMDVLSPLRASIQCSEKQVCIPLENSETLIVEGHRHGSKLNIISCIQASKYLLKDCHGNLAHVWNTGVKEERLEDVPVARDFPEVFPEDLPGLPPKRQVQFGMELIHGAASIARAPYRLAPSKMKEISDSIERIIRQGFHSTDLVPLRSSSFVC